MLLIEWSASGVRIFDPTQRRSTHGTSLKECLAASGSASREAIVALSSRSAFIRTVPVPNVSHEEMHRMIALKLVPLLPFHPGEYVFGFRAGASSGKVGRKAIAGAAKTELVRDILQQAKDAGIRVRTIVPLAFGSWLAARAHNLRDGAVVEQEGDFLCVDLIAEGELLYSRSIPVPDSSDAILAEIDRTFAMADFPKGSILSTGLPLPGASQQEPRQAIEFLADHAAVDRQLFSLELPEAAAARRRRASNSAMQRALLASILAVALGGYEYTLRTAAQKDAAKQTALNQRKVSVSRREQSEAISLKEAASAQSDLVRLAFHPAQNFSDVVTVLGGSINHKVWLNGLTLERGRPVILRGVAATGKELADYIDDISVGDRFRGLRVLSAINGSIGKKSVVQFSITGWIVGNLPIDASAAKVKP